MQTDLTFRTEEFLFTNLDDAFFIPVNALFKQGNYLVESVDAPANGYRKGVSVSDDKKNVVYVTQDETGFWNEHLSSDSFTFIVKEKYTHEKVKVQLRFVRHLTEFDGIVPHVLLNLPPDTTNHIRLELGRYFKHYPFKIVKEAGYDRRMFSNVVVTGEDSTNLDLFINPEADLCDAETQIRLLIENKERDETFITHIYVLPHKPQLLVAPKVARISWPLPNFILYYPEMVNTSSAVDIVSVNESVPERGEVLIHAEKQLLYVLNLDSGYWEVDGNSDLLGFAVSDGEGDTPEHSGGNYLDVIRVASDAIPTHINPSEEYQVRELGFLILEEQLTPDGTYSDPYRVTGSLGIEIDDFVMGIPFVGVVDFGTNPREIVPDSYSSVNFSVNTTFGEQAVISGYIDGVPGTIEVGQTIVLTTGAVQT